MSASIQTLRKNARDIFQAGIDESDPYQAVKNCLTITNNHIEIVLDLNDKAKKRSGRWSKIYVFGIGKAACNMAKAAEEMIPTCRLAGRPIAITNYENVKPLKNIEVIGAGHPYPDSSGQKAAELIIEKLKKTESDELVLFLISGGGSALLASPAENVTLDDKIAMTDLLLASGADIQEINCVRKHLSKIKGGNLARHAAPAELHTLILSDVLDNDPGTIASGPTVPDKSTFLDAVNILREKDIWDKAPQKVKNLLEKGVQGDLKETPKPGDSFFKRTSFTLIGSNSISLNALVNAAKKLNYETDIFSKQLQGEARDMAEQIVLLAKKRTENGLTQTLAIVSGGETTVTIKGKGCGGRNQEMALAFAIAAENHQLKEKWTFLSGGTDGRDGPTDAAGGIVDQGTLARISKTGSSPEKKLNNNDSYSALKKSQDLLITGPTGTNVADLQVLLIHPN